MPETPVSAHLDGEEPRMDSVYHDPALWNGRVMSVVMILTSLPTITLCGAVHSPDRYQGSQEIA
jgi:hypothetical protein